MRVLDLFAGIGGFSLAGHHLGFQTVAFVEKDPYCQKVLEKNFPGVKIYEDIKETDFRPYRGTIDILCGGFPCQPFSSAGKRGGKDDDRFLWPEMARAIRECRPTWVVGENVSGLLTMESGAVLDEVCSDLENEGYEVRTFVLPAVSVGAPHRRDRVWIIANAKGEQDHSAIAGRLHPQSIGSDRESPVVVDSYGVQEKGRSGFIQGEAGYERVRQQDGMGESGYSDRAFIEADSDDESSERESGVYSRPGREGLADVHSTSYSHSPIERWCEGYGWPWGCDPYGREIFSRTADSDGEGLEGWESCEGIEQGGESAVVGGYRGLWASWWLEAATLLCRVDDGLPQGLDTSERSAIYRAVKQYGREEVEGILGIDLREVEDRISRTNRLKVMGNSIVPQVVYEIFYHIKSITDRG